MKKVVKRSTLNFRKIRVLLLFPYNKIKILFSFLITWRRLRKKSSQLFSQLTEDIHQREFDVKQQEIGLPSGKISAFETLEDLKHASLGKFIAGCIKVLFPIFIILFFVSLSRVNNSLVSFNLTVNCVSFSTNTPLDLNAMTISSGSILVHEVGINGLQGEVIAFANNQGENLQVSFQDIPKQCNYILDHLNADQFSITCRNYPDQYAFNGSISNFNSIEITDSQQVSRVRHYENEPISFDRGNLFTPLNIINSLPELWKIGPVEADSILFLKPNSRPGASFSLLKGTVHFDNNLKDSISLTYLDTLIFISKNPVRLFLEKTSNGLQVFFQTEVSELFAGSRSTGKMRNLMPRKGDVWRNRMPGYIPEVFIAGIASLLLLLLIRQRRAA